MIYFCIERVNFFFFLNYCPLWHFISLKIISRRLIYKRFYLRNKICHKGQYDSHSKGSCRILHCMYIVSPTILLNVLAKRNEVFRKTTIFYPPKNNSQKYVCKIKVGWWWNFSMNFLTQLGTKERKILCSSWVCCYTERKL